MFYSSLIYVGIEFDESCTAFMPSIGTRSDSVKPTGHARFSVELCRLIRNYKLFSQETQMDKKVVYFLLFILSCETFSN